MVSDYLINLLPISDPLTVLDLGAGEGSLTLAASNRWSSTSFVTMDIDNASAEKLSQKLVHSDFRGRHLHIENDALCLNIGQVLQKNSVSSTCAAICNPPFLIPEWKSSYSEILEDAKLSGSISKIAHTDAAVLFLAQNLRILSKNGTLGIIIPDSIASAEKYRQLRKKLLTNYKVLRSIKLPRGSFAGTDALAHILIIQNCTPSSNQIELGELTTAGRSFSLNVAVDKAAERLDYAYHSARIKNAEFDITVRKLAIDLRRGSLSSSEIKKNTAAILHTTGVDESMYGLWVDFESWGEPSKLLKDMTVIAEAGDVIIARVGRNCSNKVFGIKSGKVPLSDCLFRLKIPSEYRLEVLDQLASPVGKHWLETHAHGVAASHITKQAILDFPLRPI